MIELNLPSVRLANAIRPNKRGVSINKNGCLDDRVRRRRRGGEGDGGEGEEKRGRGDGKERRYCVRQYRQRAPRDEVR